MGPQRDQDLEELRELYDITLKIARRAVRDLRHAIDQIPPDSPLRDMFVERQRHYARVLTCTSDYRIELHLEIDRLERRLQAEMNRQQAPPDDPDQLIIPF